MRLYRKAYETKCLYDELYQIVVAFSSHSEFKCTTEVTNRIKETIYGKIASEDSSDQVQDLFEYANEQMIELGLGDDSSDAQLYPLVAAKKKELAMLTESSRQQS